MHVLDWSGVGGWVGRGMFLDLLPVISIILTVTTILGNISWFNLPFSHSHTKE